MNRPQELTTTRLIAAASNTLLSNGYHQVSVSLGEFSDSVARVFEDEYGIVAVLVFETWSDLRNKWPISQDLLVSLMSQHIRKTEAKAWEGYLVLLTPSTPGSDAQLQADQIRYDTLRVRKLVGTGDDLQELSSVERVLLPVLPLKTSAGTTREESSLLSILPTSLARKGIPEEATRFLVRAIREGRSLLEALHDYVVNR